MASPLRDLSYRNYEVTGGSRAPRWTVIARNHLQRIFGIKSFWVLTILGGLHYLLLIAVAYFTDIGGEDISQQFFSRLVWRDQFLSGFQVGHFLLMAVVLLGGAGLIANDLRANALLVYLSKPCTKLDYVFGKFMGLFTVLVAALGLPALFFYVYGALNYREHGFLSDDPWLGPKILICVTLVSAYQASIMLGISSLFRQGRLAGAAYAGIYVLSGLFAGIPQFVARVNELSPSVQETMDRIHYLSIYGGIEGIYKVILQTSGSSMFSRDTSGVDLTPPPELWLLLLVTMVPATLGWIIAIRKVRAVEVVS